MRYYHFCDCGPHFHCGEEIVHWVCEMCSSEYIGPDCEVARPLPVRMRENGKVLCDECYKKMEAECNQESNSIPST